MAQSLNLLGGFNRVETPFVKVQIGDYTFGVFDKKADTSNIAQTNITYPNYIQTLNITKINGQVNTYTLNISYPVREGDDPNFFEKVFGSVSKTRKIVFSYGDLSVPTYLYKEEQAIITKVTEKMSVSSSVITYVVYATSSAALAVSGTFNFREQFARPSDIIKNELLRNTKYGLTEIFPGMLDIEKVLTNNLIASNDQEVQLEFKQNISVMEYLSYLVRCMTPIKNNFNTVQQSSLYNIVIIDDTTGEYGGAYFKVVESNDTSSDELGTYELDIGYPSNNIVLDFSVNNDENYSILYEYNNKLYPSQYTQRINDKGEMETTFAPNISSRNSKALTKAEDKSWWTRVTQYSIGATITIKGLLRPAILTSYVRLNVYFYGQKHISSGLYIVTKQEDSVGIGIGFRTRLTLTRIKGDTQ